MSRVLDQSHYVSERLCGLESYLNVRIKGQEDAIGRLAQAVISGECDLDERGPRPKGAFLFMGTRGIGKTESAKAFSEYLFGTEAFGMFFMNEYQQAENARELPAMMKAHLNKGTRTFLFDEIEKAHRSVIDLFISLLDEGQITQIDGTRTNVGDTYLVMTSNIGAARWASMMATNYSRMEAFAYEQARRILRPELFNRLTETIVFRPLREDVQEAILAELVSKKLSYLHNRLGLRLSLDEQARTHLLRTCFTQTEGARRLRQELDRQINAAVLPYAIDRTQPVTEVIRYDPENDKLILV